MSDVPTPHTLIAHHTALAAAGTAIRLVRRVPAPLKPIADQVIRSASSVAANLAEGHGRFGRDRQHRLKPGPPTRTPIPPVMLSEARRAESKHLLPRGAEGSRRAPCPHCFP